MSDQRNQSQDTFDVLRNLSTRLNTITDRANESVREVEKFLNEECSIGIKAHIKIRDIADGVPEANLEYRRVGSRYRIAVVEINEQGQDTKVKPWTDCSRNDKLSSFEFLPELLANIASSVEESLQEAETTARKVADAIAALGKK
jgi:hypothetical protein